MSRTIIAAACLLSAGVLGVTAGVPADDIYWAVRMGDAAGVAVLLADGAEVNTPNEEGLTPLHLAAMYGNADLVRLLLAAGADARTRDGLGRTPLHYAAGVDAQETLALLTAAGGDVAAPDQQGNTPLHVAARRAKAVAVGFLLSGGADVSERNSAGQTPLHVLGVDAREADDPEMLLLTDTIARVMIAAGADPQARDHAGEIAWPHAWRAGERQPSGYPSYTDIITLLQTRATQYPNICQRIDLGTSVQGRHIYALRITDNLDVQEDEPEFKWVANMHGDEVTGVVLCLNMIDYLLQNYPADPRVANLVDEMDTWIVPTMNPDGYVSTTRYNAHGQDLNRDFPEGSGPNPEPNTVTGREPETAVIMNWSFGQSFTLSANYHGGALVVNYPFDNDNKGSVFSPTPDEDLFVYISEQYSVHNPPMWNSAEFYHGITNGAAWYSISGGMQDWNYRYMGDNDVTIEVSSNKAPPYSQMPQFWNENRESMLAYMETAFLGVRGLVTDAATGAPLAATVSVVDRNHNVYTDPDVGDYHRMLLPGDYQLRVEAAGYDTLVFPVTVNAGPATRLDVAMSPPVQLTYPNGGETLTTGVPATVSWNGSPSGQFHVQYSSNYGATGTVSDGFENGTLDPAYTTGGNLPWYVTTGTTHSGTYAARAGAITHSQSTWMTRTASAGPLSFWYRVSSEANYDWFTFYVDGVQKVHRSGTVAWTQYTQTLGAGTHTLKWEYAKDSGVSYGSDTVWIDDLSLTTDATTWTDIIALTPPGAASTSWTPTTPSSTNKVRVRTYYGAGAYGAFDESDAVFTVIQGPQYEKGDTNCDLAVDFADINPFVLALTDPAGYAEAFPACPVLNADINEDGEVGFGDINPFVALLTGGP